MSTHAHPDTPDGWADSVSDWAAENAAELRHFTGIPQAHRALPLPAERQWVAPQGRPAQGWPARRCSPEMACWDSTQDDQTDSADGEVLTWLLKGAFVVGAALLCAWFIAGGLNV
jgi:hypothetical protein